MKGLALDIVSIINILSLSLIGCLMIFLASYLGFFRLVPRKDISISFLYTGILFFIYLTFLFPLPICFSTIFSDFPPSYVPSFIQFLLSITLMATLFLCVKVDPKKQLQHIVKHPDTSSKWYVDFFIGCLTWCVAFPWVTACNQLITFLIYPFSHGKLTDQSAVTYLKNSLGSPLQAVMALTCVVFIAPIVEEFMFRGVLQQSLKKIFSKSFAIILTSFIFALFHFSLSQSMLNFSLIPSLFILSCFLGYVYERQGSIYASIGLHMSFNLISCIQILLLVEA